MTDVVAIPSTSMSAESENSDTPTPTAKGSECTDEPAHKRIRLTCAERPKAVDKLENRLQGILCCAVCLDLPRSAIYQCTNGHLMCAGCFTHLLADARLRDETATCPNCRTVISKELACRNLAVQKAVCELPTDCRHCGSSLPRSDIERHETQLCEERQTQCVYHRIGCMWRGPHHELEKHAAMCTHPLKTGREVMEVLERLDDQLQQRQKLYDSIFDLLSFEKITFNDLQCKPYRTDEFIHKLYYETHRFTAFNLQWVVKAFVNNNQKDPQHSCERTLGYQLVLKTKITAPIHIHYMILRGPFGEMKVFPRLFNFQFTEALSDSQIQPLPLEDSDECNKLLATKLFNFRLIMFQVPQ